MKIMSIRSKYSGRRGSLPILFVGKIYTLDYTQKIGNAERFGEGSIQSLIYCSSIKNEGAEIEQGSF